MKNFNDLIKPLGFGISYVRQLAGFVYPGVKLFTDEQVQHLIEVRAEMKAGLSWNEIETRYAAQEETEPEEEPTSDSAIQETVQQNVGELKHKIRQVSTRVMASMVAKDATDLVSNLPYLSLGANLQAMNHGDELMSESFSIVEQIIESEPNGDCGEILEVLAERIDSSYEQGRRITGTSSLGDFAALEAAAEETEPEKEEKEKEDQK